MAALVGTVGLTIEPCLLINTNFEEIEDSRPIHGQ